MSENASVFLHHNCHVCVLGICHARGQVTRCNEEVHVADMTMVPMVVAVDVSEVVWVSIVVVPVAVIVIMVMSQFRSCAGGYSCGVKHLMHVACVVVVLTSRASARHRPWFHEL